MSLDVQAAVPAPTGGGAAARKSSGRLRLSRRDKWVLALLLGIPLFIHILGARGL